MLGFFWAAFLFFALPLLAFLSCLFRRNFVFRNWRELEKQSSLSVAHRLLRLLSSPPLLLYLSVSLLTNPPTDHLSSSALTGVKSLNHSLSLSRRLDLVWVVSLFVARPSRPSLLSLYRSRTPTVLGSLPSLFLTDLDRNWGGRSHFQILLTKVRTWSYVCLICFYFLLVK